jgi:CMP-N,N'-diacetyllegionaminic acid synthase
VSLWQKGFIQKLPKTRKLKTRKPIPRKSLIVALIPARAGSLRVKNKNLKILGGKPLIVHTISAALKAKMIDRVFVSTDSEVIARVARKAGAEVPFLRPKSISGPGSTEFEFHQHFLEWCLGENYLPDLIVNLYPTSPFRKSKTIDEACQTILKNSKADSLRSIVPCKEHPYKMWVEKKAKLIQPFVSRKKRSDHTLSYQRLPKVYIQNASIYITRPRTLKRYKSTIGRSILGFQMRELESLDVNTEIDFKIAQGFIR